MKAAPRLLVSVREPSRPRLVHTIEPVVIWDDYLRVEPGRYQACCKSALWYRDPDFKRWTCLLRFEIYKENLIHSFGTIPMWMNGGAKDKPEAGRRSRYFAEWVKANGAPPPRKDRLSPTVFIKRMTKVEVADTTRGTVPYSVVREILEWLTGKPVNQSHSQGRQGSRASQ